MGMGISCGREGNFLFFRPWINEEGSFFPSVPEDKFNSISRQDGSGIQSGTYMYRVQLELTPEIEVFYMLFDRSLSIFSMISLKQHIEYFNFRCKIQVDLPV